jgi:hypothetical protein
MLRSFTTLTTTLLLAATAAAQCLNTVSPGTTLGSGDETLYGPVAMGISFPMAGAGGPFTHCVVNTNGVLYLTTGGAAVGANTFEWGDDPAHLQGAAGASPRVAAFWSDLVLTGPAGLVAIDTSVAGRCAVTWLQATEYLQAATKSFQAELFSTGVVRFSYSAGMVCDGAPALVGVSIGNAAALPPASDLSAAPLSPNGITFQQFDPTTVPFDLGGAAITFTPSGGGYQVATTCQPASHQAYGSGCYSVAAESFYQYFPTAAAAAAALNGQSMRLVPTTNGYTVTWGGGSYVVPPAVGAGATLLTVSDDDQAPVVPSIPLPVPGGTAPVLYVHANGFVSTATGNDNGSWNTPANDYTPTSQFRNAPAAAFWSWHDYTTLQGAGRVKYHQATGGGNTILYVTWDAVESYAIPETANPSTFQFQFNLTTGAVTYVWQSLTAIGTGQSPSLPESHLIGYSAAGASADPGPIVLATALPLTTQPDLLPVSLSAAPTPVINPSTVVTYTASALPEAVPGSGLHLSTLFLSVNPLPGGFDLGVIGAPGCSAYLVTLDLDLGGQLTLGPTASWNLSYDNVLFAPGNVIGAQAVALITPFSLPNNQNAFGLTVSNGVRSYVNSF